MAKIKYKRRSKTKRVKRIPNRWKFFSQWKWRFFITRPWRYLNICIEFNDRDIDIMITFMDINLLRISLYHTTNKWEEPEKWIFFGLLGFEVNKYGN